MLTFEKVLEKFADYLKEDTRYEMLMTTHGYTLVEWDSIQKDWAGIQLCASPEEMRDVLLDALSGYLEFQATHGSRELTPSDKKDIQMRLRTISDALK